MLRPYIRFWGIWVLGDLMFVVGWGRVYEIVVYRQLLLVNPPLQNYGDIVLDNRATS